MHPRITPSGLDPFYLRSWTAHWNMLLDTGLLVATCLHDRTQFEQDIDEFPLRHRGRLREAT